MSSPKIGQLPAVTSSYYLQTQRGISLLWLNLWLEYKISTDKLCETAVLLGTKLPQLDDNFFTLLSSVRKIYDQLVSPKLTIFLPQPGNLLGIAPIWQDKALTDHCVFSISDRENPSQDTIIFLPAPGSTNVVSFENNSGYSANFVTTDSEVLQHSWFEIQEDIITVMENNTFIFKNTTDNQHINGSYFHQMISYYLRAHPLGPFPDTVDKKLITFSEKIHSLAVILGVSSGCIATESGNFWAGYHKISRFYTESMSSVLNSFLE